MLGCFGTWICIGCIVNSHVWEFYTCHQCCVDMGGFFGCDLNVGIGEILLLLFLAARLVGLLGFAVIVQLS
jgi:hypothetical protein